MLDESDHRELQAEAVRLTIYAVAITALTLNLAIAFTGLLPRLTWLTVGELFATSLLAHQVLRHGSSLAARTLLIGLGLTIASTAWLFPDLPITAALCLVVFLAGVLIDWRASVFSVVVCSLLVGAFAAGKVGGAPSSASALIASALLAASALVSYLAARPVEVALTWSWRHYEWALEVAEESRRRQGELGRLAKSLNETCAKLEELTAELERARRAAAEARRLKEEFAATVSHEMRTPLNLVIGFSELMVVEPESSHSEPLPASYQSDAQAIYRNACHLSQLIDDVLDLAQIEAHRMALDKQPTAVARVVDEAVTTVSSLFERRGLALRVEVPSDLPLLNMDRTRVRQILVNLLGNAARFTSQGGVVISAELRDEECVVSVADTGTGMPPEVLARVFEEFRQFGDSSSRRAGSGLGLAISKRLAELHGGAMWVESRVGEGSVFRFSLPCQGNVVAVPLRDEWETWARVAPADTARTLVVLDPVGECARLLRRYLDGYDVRRVTSAEAARAILTERPVAALLVAGGLAGSGSLSLDGDSAAILSPDEGFSEDALPPDNLVDSRSVDVPVISCRVRGIREIGDDLGAAEYLVKPVSQAQLVSALGRLGLRPATILVADDDPDMVRLLELAVRSIPGVERVLTATDGSAALATMRASLPDVVLLDLMMPWLDGPGVIHAMREDPRLREVPVIVVSARGPAEERVAVADLAIHRRNNLSAAEFIRCLRASLGALDGAPPLGSAPAPSAGSPE